MSAERRRPLAGVTGRAMVVVFLATTFALTWLMFLPVIVGFVDPESPVGLILLPLIGVGAPTIMAFVLTGLSESRRGVRELWRGGRRWRVGIPWYAIVVFLPGLVYAIAWVADSGLTVPSIGPWAPALVSGLLAGILEELGWSGFAFPRLQKIYGFVPAGLAMGCTPPRVCAAAPGGRAAPPPVPVRSLGQRRLLPGAPLRTVPSAPSRTPPRSSPARPRARTPRRP